ncbi:hypothetical protein ACFLZV_06110 [Candidatus Margulisiibacteriota bacterium]
MIVKKIVATKKKVPPRPIKLLANFIEYHPYYTQEKKAFAPKKLKTSVIRDGMTYRGYDSTKLPGGMSLKTDIKKTGVIEIKIKKDKNYKAAQIYGCFNEKNMPAKESKFTVVLIPKKRSESEVVLLKDFIMDKTGNLTNAQIKAFKKKELSTLIQLKLKGHIFKPGKCKEFKCQNYHPYYKLKQDEIRKINEPQDTSVKNKKFYGSEGEIKLRRRDKNTTNAKIGVIRIEIEQDEKNETSKKYGACLVYGAFDKNYYPILKSNCTIVLVPRDEQVDPAKINSATMPSILTSRRLIDLKLITTDIISLKIGESIFGEKAKQRNIESSWEIIMDQNKDEE